MTAGMNPRSLRTAETGTRRYARGEASDDSGEKCLTSQAPGDGKAGRFATRTDVAVNRAAVNAPVIPELKCVAYRLWFVTVIFLEYGLIKKQVAWRYANGAHDDDWLWSRFTLQTQWLNITLHSLIDLATLFYLNALHPRWGVRRPSDGDGAAEPLVPASVPLLARHMLKLTLRIPPLNSWILGAKWGCHHAFTNKQALAITLSPSYIEILLDRFSFGGLVLMGLMNSVFMVILSFSNSHTYICHEAVRETFLQEIGGEYDASKFRMSLPIVFLAPFLFDEVRSRWPSVSRGVWAWTRLSNRLFFGACERSVSGITPSTAGAFARRLRTAASIVIKVVAASLAAVNMANGVPLLLAVTAAWAQTSVPRFVFSRLSASARWCYAPRASTNGLAVAAARWAVSSAFACAAAVTTVAARMCSTGDDFDAAESSRTWATAFAAVAAATHACTPGVGAFVASGGAALDAAVFVVGRACIDPDGGFDASAVWLAFAGSYASALHLNDLVTFARRAAARRSSRWCTKKRVVVREGRAANDHWRLEDFVIDPIGFEVRAAKAKLKDRHRFKPMAYDASTNDPPRVMEKLTCRAKNCCREVDEQNLMAASVALCLEHFTSKKPFEYGSLTCAALFCLMCRRVHAPPLCRECMLFSGREGAKFTIKSRRTPCAREEIGGNDVFMIHMSLKTEEDPVTAVNRARGVFQDIAAENRGSMHAVMSARPGCTIVSVDMVIDDSEESSDIHVGAPSESDGPESARRSLTDAVEKFVSRLAQNGSRRGVQGTLYFRALNPRTGAMQTRRIIFRAEDRDVSHVGPVEDATTLAILDSHPTLRRVVESLHDPKTKMLVVRSDCFDEVRLPTPPLGFHYVLRLEGTYLPLLMPDDERLHTATASQTTDEVDVLLPPTQSEGLGFFELVKSLDSTGGDELSEATEVLLTLPVFMTPDRALALELLRDRDSGGVCMEHVPVLFDLGASLRRDLVMSPDIEPLDASRNLSGSINAPIQQTIFHAACTCASLGWLIALTRVLDVHEGNTLTDANDRGDPVPRQMSTDPDTATDGSIPSLHSYGESMIIPTLRTKRGILGLLRSACSSGDAAIVKAVAVMAIQHRGAVEVGELMCEYDPAFISPLHATAMATARKAWDGAKRGGVLRNLVSVVTGDFTMMSPPVKNAAEATILALTLASDPLSWVSERASSGQEFPMAFASRHAFVRILKSRCAAREISAANTRVIDVLAGAVVHAMRALHNSRFAPFGVSKMITDWSVDTTHANAAATLIALRYDGSSRATIAAALLSPGSSHYLGAFRRRVLDDTRGEVGWDEARAWLLAGASPHGFPPANATETRSGRIGIAAVAAAVAMDATLALTVGDGAGALAAAVTMAMLATIGLAAKTKHRRFYLCHYLRANTIARLVAFVVAMAVDSVESAWSTSTAFRVAVCVVQAWAAPAGKAADAVIVGTHTMVVGASWWVAAIAAGTVVTASVADDRCARRARERLAKAA